MHQSCHNIHESSANSPHSHVRRGDSTAPNKKNGPKKIRRGIACANRLGSSRSIPANDSRVVAPHPAKLENR